MPAQPASAARRASVGSSTPLTTTSSPAAATSRSSRPRVEVGGLVGRRQHRVRQLRRERRPVRPAMGGWDDHAVHGQHDRGRPAFAHASDQCQGRILVLARVELEPGDRTGDGGQVLERRVWLVETSIPAPTPAAARAVAASPSGWASLWAAIGATSSGAESRWPSTVVPVSGDCDPASTRGTRKCARHAAVFARWVTSSRAPVE